MSKSSERKKLVKDKVLSEEETEALVTRESRELVRRLLEEKGYLPEEIEDRPAFTITTSNRKDISRVDYIIRLNGRRYMAIKCSMALESRERHVLSFSRVVDSCQIPYSVITDGLKAYLMDTLTGRLISEEMDSIPAREEALRDIENLLFREYPPEKMEMEKRILLAFECTNCPGQAD